VLARYWTSKILCSFLSYATFNLYYKFYRRFSNSFRSFSRALSYLVLNLSNIYFLSIFCWLRLSSARSYLSLYFANISLGESLLSLFCSNLRCIWSSIRVRGTFIGVTDLDR
jgi:hypothetical protein